MELLPVYLPLAFLLAWPALVVVASRMSKSSSPRRRSHGRAFGTVALYFAFNLSLCVTWGAFVRRPIHDDLGGSLLTAFVVAQPLAFYLVVRVQGELDGESDDR